VNLLQRRDMIKAIRPISVLLVFYLIAISVPCLAEEFEAFPVEVSSALVDETVPAEVAMTPPEPSLLEELLEIVASSEPLESFDPAEGFVSVPESQEPIQTALANVPPESLSTEEPVETIADPLEPVNRAFFKFNDRFYFWILKPVATGYKTVVPQDLRVGVRNFFSNVTTPVRLVNCLLQAKFKCGGNETVRFLVNTIFGLAGFLDTAKKDFEIEKQEADFGQTLGVWGIGPAFFINWPILGPSSLRDSVGYVGDLFLDPQNYLITSTPVNLAIKSYDQVNETSLTLGEYEDLKEAALDPYIALKDAFHQYRQKKIKER
jgi:phospholipid-binding lipoprotein MlaA